MAIETKNIVKQFGAFTALQDINLRIDSGELVALLGPSGSGKINVIGCIVSRPKGGLFGFTFEMR